MSPIQMRANPEVVAVLRQLARQERRSLSNMLESLVMSEGERRGLIVHRVEPVTVTRPVEIPAPCDAETLLGMLNGLDGSSVKALSQGRQRELRDLLDHWQKLLDYWKEQRIEAAAAAAAESVETDDDDDSEALAEAEAAPAPAAVPPLKPPSPAESRDQEVHNTYILCGGRATATARSLNERGIRPPRGERWTRDGVNGWLRRQARRAAKREAEQRG